MSNVNSAVTSMCNICCDDYKVAEMVTCKVCSYASCKSCTKQYLLNTRSAQCMNTECRAHWSDCFIRDSLNKSWVDKEYKQHIKMIVLDMERGFLPESMPYASDYKLYREEELKEKEIDAVRKIVQERKIEYDQKMRKIQRKKNECKSKQEKESLREEKNSVEAVYREAKDSYDEMVSDHRLSLMILGRPISRYLVKVGNRAQEEVEEDDDKEEERNNQPVKYSMRCPQDGCNAFINGESWKCGVCNTQVCRSCRQIKAEASEEEHKCKESDVASVKAIMADKDIKPCPKCSELIFRPFGCNHMWCTACHTSFDWESGRVISDSVNTNPYYYAWKNSQKKGNSDITEPSPFGACDSIPEIAMQYYREFKRNLCKRNQEAKQVITWEKIVPVAKWTLEDFCCQDRLTKQQVVYKHHKQSDLVLEKTRNGYEIVGVRRFEGWIHHSDGPKQKLYEVSKSVDIHLLCWAKKCGVKGPRWTTKASMGEGCGVYTEQHIDQELHNIDNLLTDIQTLQADFTRLMNSPVPSYLPHFNRLGRMRYLIGEYSEDKMASEAYNAWKRNQFNIAMRTLISELSMEINQWYIDFTSALTSCFDLIWSDLSADRAGRSRADEFAVWLHKKTPNITVFRAAIYDFMDKVQAFNAKSRDLAKAYSYTSVFQVINNKVMGYEPVPAFVGKSSSYHAALPTHGRAHMFKPTPMVAHDLEYSESSSDQ